jgi:outer membrane protein assembly factor BamB
LVTDISVAGQSLLNAPGQTDILWKMPLMALVASPPKLIEQSAGKNYVLIQDVQNRLYCLDAQNGAIVWNKQFSGRILSDIQGIDFYGNGSKCYTFNTATQVFTLDEAGRDVQGFPLKLPAPATNGMLVVDFDKNTKFSYFVACENGRLYGLGHLGKALDGWNARPLSSKQQDAVARQPMVHFQHKGKDYLALLTEKGEFSVFGRDGSLRFPALQWDGIFKGPLSADATAATPRFYAANTSGKLFACDLQGNARTIQAGNSNTTAAFGQLTGDACYEWAVLEGKKAHIGAWEKPEGARLFSIEFPEKQHRVFFCPNRRIGSVDQRGRRVWLFNEKGQALPGFPLGGNTPFVLGEINGVEMLVAGNGNTVWAYRVRS